MLERRVAKLTALLDSTEAELVLARARGGGSTGVASIHDSVQGLDLEDARYEEKSALMRAIFDANVALRDLAR